MSHRPLASPTFSDDGLLGQEGVDCHALASMSSKPQPWQHRVLPVGALGGSVKQGRRSQQQMLGKQKVQAVLHSGCQDPLALQGVKQGIITFLQRSDIYTYILPPPHTASCKVCLFVCAHISKCASAPRKNTTCASCNR